MSIFLPFLEQYQCDFAHYQATLLGSAEGGKGLSCRGRWHV